MPIIGLVAIVRTAVCVYRSYKAKSKLFVLLSSLSIILMIGIMAFVVIVLFGYGVAHTGKDASTDIVILAITVIPTYIGAFGIWRLSIFIESRLNTVLTS
jgi:high-affinity K+ transport system ATPase subunit B